MTKFEREVSAMYVRWLYSSGVIAKKLGVSKSRVLRTLESLGVGRRAPTDAHPKVAVGKECLTCKSEFKVGGRGNQRPGAKYCSRRCAMLDRYAAYETTLRSESWLRQKYETEGLTSGEIGKLVGCPHTSVIRVLKGFGIPLRGISASRKALFDRRGRKDVTQAELKEAYGGKCVCCGETEPVFLSLDHIGGHLGEAKKNEPEFKGNYGRLLRRWLKANNWPKEHYRLLCMNCQFGYMRGKTCPHQLKKKK